MSRWQGRRYWSGVVKSWSSLRRRRSGGAPRPETPSPVVGLALSGGGASASFHIGALRYLYDVVGITPSVITGTSAGSIIAAVLAQAGDHRGQRTALAVLERVYQGLRDPSDMLVELDWFLELQKLAPALQRVGQARASRAEPQTIFLPTLGLRRRPGSDGEAREAAVCTHVQL